MFCFINSLKLTLLLVLIIGGNSNAQVRQQEGKLNVNTAPGGIVEEIRLEAPEKTGTHYLEEDWLLADIFLVNEKRLEGKYIKYDLESHAIEIKDAGRVSILEGDKVDRFRLTKPAGDDANFLNANRFTEDGTPLVGFVELLQSGKVLLLRRKTLNYIKPNYIPALDTGDRSGKYVQVDKLYLSDGKKLIKAPRTNKKLIKYLGDHENRTFEYIKKNTLSCKDVDDLKAIIHFHNTAENTQKSGSE